MYIVTCQFPSFPFPVPVKQEDFSKSERVKYSNENKNKWVYLSFVLLLFIYIYNSHTHILSSDVDWYISTVVEGGGGIPTNPRFSPRELQLPTSENPPSKDTRVSGGVGVCLSLDFCEHGQIGNIMTSRKEGEIKNKTTPPRN